MHPLYRDFISALDSADKARCVRFALNQLERRALDIVTLYNDILTPAQYTRFCKADQQEICIWEEHVRTSIVRTIIECSYPYILREKEDKHNNINKGSVVVLCPPGELHEIGARMVADFFTLSGFEPVFVGANTPEDDIINAVKYTQPYYVAISITNYYNLIAARNVVEKIKELKSFLSFRIILGGQACKSNTEACRQLGTDFILDTFADISKLQGR